MIRAFFRDSALYGIATILSKGLAVLMVPIYTAYLSQTQMGALELILGATSILSLVIGLDISNALAREYGESKEPEVRRRYSSTSLWFSVIVYGIALIAILALAKPLAEISLGSVAHASAIRAAAFSMFVGGIYIVVVQQLRWMMRPGKFGLTNVSFTLISLSVTVLLVGYLHLGEAGVLYGTCSGSLAGIALALLFSKGEFSWTFDWGCLKKMLLFCIPIVPSGLSIVISQYISRFLIEWELGRGPVGVYAIAVRLAGLAGLAMVGFGSALTPLIYSAQNDPQTPLNLARIFRLFVYLASFALAGMTLFSGELIKLLTRSDYSLAGPLLPFLAPAFLLMQMYIFAPGAWISRKMWWVAAVNILTVLTSIILGLLFVPFWGLKGAAIATLVSSSINFILSMAVSQRLYNVPHNWLQLLAVTGAAIMVMVGAAYFPVEVSFNLFITKVAILVAFGLCILAGAHAEREWVLAKLKFLRNKAKCE